MTDSKRQMMRQGSATRRPGLTQQDRQDMKEKLVGPENRTTRALFVLDEDDIRWLDDTVNRLKRTRRKTSKSQLVRLGVSLIRDMSQEELIRLLRDFE